MRPQKHQLAVGDLVLTFNVPRSLDMSRNVKLSYRWQGPYRVTAISPKRAYSLETLDGVSVAGTFAPSRLKKFVYKDGVYDPAPGQEEIGELLAPDTAETMRAENDQYHLRPQNESEAVSAKNLEDIEDSNCGDRTKGGKSVAPDVSGDI